MSDEFKVMPWLRKVRDEHAAKQAGLTPMERLDQDRKAAAEVKDRLFKRKTAYPQASALLTRVAETDRQSDKSG